MTDHRSTHEYGAGGSASGDRSSAALSPAIHRIVLDVVPPRDRSLPVALCLSAGTATAAIDGDALASESSARTDDRLEPLTNAVALLEGYVRLRTTLLRNDRDEPTDRRDAALLASDSLHAAAYEPIATASVSERRTLELYRVLAAGSSSLAARFTRSADERAPDEDVVGTGTKAERGTEAGAAGARSDDTAGPDPDGARSSSVPVPGRTHASLAATAAALGATATGASTDTRTALETYARSLATALHVGADVLPTTSSDDVDPSPDPPETAVRILSGPVRATGGTTAVDDSSSASTSTSTSTSTATAAVAPTSPSTVERHLERARDALATIAESGASTVDHPSIARLERATRIPFRHEE